MSQDQKVESREIPSGGSPMKRILAQWRRERPDIDPMPMAVVGEIWRAGERLRQRVQANWANFDLDLAVARCWYRGVDKGQSVGIAVVGDLDGAHGLSPGGGL